MTKPFAFVVEDDPKLNEIINITLQEDFELETSVDGDEAPVLVRLIQPMLVWDGAKFPSEHRDCRAA